MSARKERQKCVLATVKMLIEKEPMLLAASSVALADFIIQGGRSA